MELRHLRYFIAVAKNLSFSEHHVAARGTGRNQPDGLGSGGRRGRKASGGALAVAVGRCPLAGMYSRRGQSSTTGEMTPPQKLCAHVVLQIQTVWLIAACATCRRRDASLKLRFLATA